MCPIKHPYPHLVSLPSLSILMPFYTNEVHVTDVSLHTQPTLQPKQTWQLQPDLCRRVTAKDVCCAVCLRVIQSGKRAAVTVGAVIIIMPYNTLK